MRYGYLLPANAEPWEMDVEKAISEHRTEHLPDVVPLWSRWRRTAVLDRFDDGHFEIDERLVRRLRTRGMAPAIYAETADMRPQEILAGRWDDAFRLLASRAEGSPIRIFHEANSKWRLPDGTHVFEWSGWPVPTFLEVWMRVADLIHHEGARVIYNVVGRNGTTDDMLDRYAGPGFVDIVSFDRFKRAKANADPPRQWRYPISRLATTDKPVWVCETGIDARLEDRRRWMASHAQVKGVKVILTFDYLITIPGLGVVDDWRWNEHMCRAWDDLPRGD